MNIKLQDVIQELKDTKRVFLSTNGTIIRPKSGYVVPMRIVALRVLTPTAFAVENIFQKVLESMIEKTSLVQSIVTNQMLTMTSLFEDGSTMTIPVVIVPEVHPNRAKALSKLMGASIVYNIGEKSYE